MITMVRLLKLYQHSYHVALATFLLKFDFSEA